MNLKRDDICLAAHSFDNIEMWFKLHTVREEKRRSRKETNEQCAFQFQTIMKKKNVSQTQSVKK